MEPNMEEALKVKANAERKFVERDFAGAKNYALKAQKLYPYLEGIPQMVATFGVHSAAEAKINGEFDFYAILGLDPSADKAKLKKQYKKMAVLLHPDKNKSVGADAAFRLVSESWMVLSDSAKRSSYDHRRSLFTLHASGAGSYDSYNSSASHCRLDTFWTVCTSCHVQYEYLRKYVNKRLSCKNCRGVFIAVETGLAPVNGSYSYSSWTGGYGSHGCGVTYVQKSVYPANCGISGHHSGHGSEHVSNLSVQWSSCPGNSAAVLDPNGSSTTVSFSNQASRKVTRRRGRGKHNTSRLENHVVPNGYSGNEQLPRRPGRPAKKTKIEVEGTCDYSNGEVALKTAGEVKMADEIGVSNLKQNAKLPTPVEASIRRCYAAPAFDVRQLLIYKARADIRTNLKEIKLSSEAAAAAEAKMKRDTNAELGESSERPKTAGQANAVYQSELRKTVSMTMIVPDSDFHDFDKDRSEDCFKPKQIWALYDEEDGMPRLYCLIREVFSVKPFKVHISYLSSKSDSEFGLVNWLDSGFTKSCGNFRAYNAEVIEHINIFSHLLSGSKAGRGGCVRIYPRSGEIWAVYRNWSPDWNRTTPTKVRHQYEMVEVLDDYSEEIGLCVAPLVKLDGFKTVYRRNTNKDAIRLIRRREMLRFSHQVPSYLLKGEGMNLPEGCWDLDPAATPEDLLQPVNEARGGKPIEAERSARFDLNETSQAETTMLIEEKLRQPEYADGTRCGLQKDSSNEPENLFRLSAVKEVHICEEPSRVGNFSALSGEHLGAVTRV